MVGSVGPLGAVADFLGLKRTLKQEQLAADLAQAAQESQQRFNAENGDILEIDPDNPAPRGHLIDIIA